MKELTLEQKAQRYDEALDRAKEMIKAMTNIGGIAKVDDIQYLFPELKEEENEDEKIRELLLDNFKSLHKACPNGFYRDGITYNSVIAWLEKKGKIDAIKNFDTEFEREISYLIASVINREHEYNQGYVKWVANVLLNYAKHELEKQSEQESKKLSLWKHWKNGIAGNGEGKLIYLIKIGNTYRLSSSLSFECDYIELSELDSFMLEKQGESEFSNKVEPKFRPGDTIVEKDLDECGYGTIMYIKNGQYIFTNGSGINIDEQDGWQLVKTSTSIEQKPANDVKSKFHQGEWVVVSTKEGDRVVQIASVEYSKDGHPSYFTTEGRWFGNGTKARLLTDKDVETITLPESRVIVKSY